MSAASERAWWRQSKSPLPDPSQHVTEVCQAEISLEELRKLWPTEPATALYLAQEGEKRYADSPEQAAECA